MAPTIPSLSNAFSLLRQPTATPSPFGATKTSTPATAQSPAINWNAITVKPPAATPSFSLSSAAKPAMPSLMSTGMQTSTPATSTPMADFSKMTSPGTSNVQSNDTALRPGQFGAGPFATIAADGTSKPSAYVQETQKPALPQISPSPASPTPVYTQTPSGSTVNPATGAVVAPAGEQSQASSFGSNTGNTAGAAGYSASAGGAPGLYAAGGSADSTTADQIFKKYLESLNPDAKETEATERLNRLNVAAETAYTNTQNQPIALPFITGQLAAQQRSQALLSKPLESEIALLQAKRLAGMEGSKAAYERLDTLEKEKRDARKPVSVGSGSSLVDPSTGKPIYTAPNEAAEAKAPQTLETEQGILQWDSAQKAWVSTGFAGTKVANAQDAAKASARSAQERATSVNTIIDGIVPKITYSTAGAVGALSQNVPGTPAYDVARMIDTIRANLGFQELQAMREQSPTGGALGQVTERELAFLQATVASLDIGQSPEQLKKNLSDIKTHFEAWRNAVVQAAQESGTSGNTGGSGGTGSGGQYDW